MARTSASVFCRSIAKGAVVEDGLLEKEGEEPTRTRRNAKTSLRGNGTPPRDKQTAGDELFLIMARFYPCTTSMPDFTACKTDLGAWQQPQSTPKVGTPPRLSSQPENEGLKREKGHESTRIVPQTPRKS